MKIAIIGSNGFLGTNAAEILSKKHQVIEAGRSNQEGAKLDALNKEDVREFLFKHKPDIVLDTVALTSSTQCENNPELAEKLNYTTTKNISEACQEINALIVFMSSAYLFDGKNGNYNEKDLTSPINQYARTKIMAEKEVLKNKKGIVLRADIMYGYNGPNKKNGVFDQILSGNPLKLREPNQLRQPIFVEDVPKVIILLAEQKQTGVFHLAGPDKINMIDFLKKLESVVPRDSLISIDDNFDQENIIKIPKNVTLDTSKIRSLGFTFTSLDEGVRRIKERLAL